MPGKYIRRADKKEIEYYEKFLYPFQDEVFAFIRSDRLYLSGGTCLSRFYYQHRYSDDLDFFFDGYLYPEEEFDILFQKIINKISEKFKIEVMLSSEYFKRAFIYKDGKPLKLEFVFENYKNIGQRKETNQIIIDSKEKIATNKITAVYDRKSVKDFIDLYYLFKDIEFDNVVKWAEYKIVPLDYEGVLIAFVDKRLEGTVLMRGDISINADMF